jgi:thiol-disulfide isomerase/thioredoxin
MFYVDWCPHCKTAKPEWDRIKRKYENQPVGGYLVECIDVDCTDDYGEVTVSKSLHGMETPPKVADLIKQYGINGYPTLKLVKDGTPYDFEAKITEPNISKFVEEILNE